ncbi:hypothetical protein Tco_1421387, partial [Tanacetum coccineum]
MKSLKAIQQDLIICGEGGGVAVVRGVVAVVRGVVIGGDDGGDCGAVVWLMMLMAGCSRWCGGGSGSDGCGGGAAAGGCSDGGGDEV